jgi:chromatin remodeling complex protein RSC6
MQNEANHIDSANNYSNADTTVADSVNDAAASAASAPLAIDTQFEALQQNLVKFKTYITEMQGQMRTLEKSVKQMKKEIPKKPTQPTVLRQPKIIGFDIPEKITSEMAQFMQNETIMSTRNAATSFITNYIRQKKLQDMNDRTRINLNAELAALFKLPLTEPLTYFNLHKYINSHFVR